ncbi:hypothetical protein LCGC14_1093950 [marine sediment metagenome]|uniref:Arsenate reductase n=2 Tax=root TaxID=1 RepID=A0A831QR17_9FLAO|nr:hypothetical protein [Pricia antarctica]
MSELATSTREIILFYNPNRDSAKQTLGYAKGEGFPVRDVDILKNGFTGIQLEELADLLQVKIEGLVNKNHPDYEEHYKNVDFDDNDWIKILRKNPELIREPIAIRGKKAMFVETPSDLSRL